MTGTVNDNREKRFQRFIREAKGIEDSEPLCQGGQGRMAEDVASDGKVCGLITLALLLMVGTAIVLRLLGVF